MKSCVYTGEACPVCSSVAINKFEWFMNYDTNCFSYHMSCRRCKTAWTDNYVGPVLDRRTKVRTATEIYLDDIHVPGRVQSRQYRELYTNEPV